MLDFLEKESATAAEIYSMRDMEARESDAYAAAKYSIIMDWVKGFGKMHVLNVGCGSGELSHLMSHYGHQSSGIDIDAGYIEMAKHAGCKNCSFQVSSVNDFKTNEKFDLIVATDVIEHILDHNAAVDKMVSLLKPGGYLIITVPAGKWLFGYHDMMLGHYRRYEKSRLLKFAGKYLEIERCRYFGFFLIPICLIFSVFLRQSYPVSKSSSGRGLFSRLLNILLKIEKKLAFPAGTSLLLMGRKRG